MENGVGCGMCFSPEIDLVTGVTLTVIGVDAMRHADARSQRLLAGLPFVFGIHQLIEAVVWWDVQGRVSPGVGEWFAWGYLAVAFGLLPWFVPWVVRSNESDGDRRRRMGWLVGLGVFVSVMLMVPVAAGPITVLDGGIYLGYQVDLFYGGPLTALYVAATCGALLLSTDRYVRWFGVVNLVAVVLLARLLSTGVISLWCVWAAVTSSVIALHLRREEPFLSRPESAHAM